MTLRESYVLLGGDLTETVTRLGDRALLMRHLRMFPEDDAAARLQSAVGARDEPGMWQAAHALRGTCRTLGLNRLAEAAERVMDAPDWLARDAAAAAVTGEHAHAVAVISLMEEGDTALAMLLHELRTPLQAILGVAQAQEGADMARIARAGRHLSEVLSGLERLAGTRPVCRELFLLPEVLRGSAALLRDALGPECPPVDVRAELRHEWMSGDPTCLTQVLLNLLTNAARHAPGCGTITLHATETDDAAVLTVRDQGCGMGEDELARAFEPHWRVGAGAGMGLGLTIARALTGRMGGALELSSAPGEGSTATVRLPGPMSDAVGGKCQSVETSRAFDGLRVLLAEDDRLNAETSAALLTGLGLRATVAHGGGETVRLARGGGFDCVFLDAHMPGADGPSVVGEIRRALPEAPIFALTAGMLPGEEERMRAAGMRECLLKPVSAQGLSRLLSRYFDDR